MDNLTSIGGSLTINHNRSLTSLLGLNNLKFIGKDLLIFFNDSLTSLSELRNVSAIRRYLDILGNLSLINLSGLEGLTSDSGISIVDNKALKSLTGLENVSSIKGYLYIRNNTSLTSLTGLNNVSSLLYDLHLSAHNVLTDLTALSRLTSIGQDIWIYDNTTLNKLTGLENIEAASIRKLNIFRNSSLASCEIKSICDYLASPNGTIQIHDNATGCNSETEVDTACRHLSVPNIGIPPLFVIYPIPAQTEVTVETSVKSTLSELIITNLHGQLVLTRQITDPKTQIDVSSLPSGVYFVRLMGERSVEVGRFVKN